MVIGQKVRKTGNKGILKEFVLGRITMVAQYSEEGHLVDNRKVFGTQ